MKSDGQLNHSLDMPARRAVERQGAPDVLKLFMGVKEPGAVEEIDTSVEILVLGGTVNKGLKLHTILDSPPCTCQPDNLHVSIDCWVVGILKNVYRWKPKSMSLKHMRLIRFHFGTQIAFKHKSPCWNTVLGGCAPPSALPE